MNQRQNVRFASLQGGRFVAALLVALFHIEGAVTKIYGPYPLNDIFTAGHAGVEYFFVLSGFLIYWVHQRDLENARNGAVFLRKRAVRVLPMYWLAFGCMVAGILTFPSLIQGRDLSWGNILSDLLLLPRQGEMILGIAWTLRHEFLFYIIFSIGILVPRVGLKPILIWQALIIANAILQISDESVWSAVTFSIYNLGFGAGILAAKQTEGNKPKVPATVLILSGCVFVAFMMVEWLYDGNFLGITSPAGQKLSTLLYIVTASLIILSLAQLEMKHPFRRIALLEMLGGASYVLYLFHGLISSCLIRIIYMFAPSLAAWTVFGIVVTLTVVCTIVIHLTVEKPLLRALTPRRASRILVQSGS